MLFLSSVLWVFFSDLFPNSGKARSRISPTAHVSGGLSLPILDVSELFLDEDTAQNQKSYPALIHGLRETSEYEKGLQMCYEKQKTAT